jgi:hypothetical protein
MWYFRGWVAAPATHGLLPDQKKEVIDVEGKPNSTRFVELEEKFQELESHLPEGPQKEAISLLHAMIQEASRRPVPASPGTGELTLKDIANLYKKSDMPGFPGGRRLSDV